jgi:16S rRNA (guanine527-N7)-methyltransferase
MRQHYRDCLSQKCEQRGVTLAGEQLDRLLVYLELLLQWRRHLNLTGLREAERLIDVLIVESLDFLQGDLLPRTARLLDLGSGAGVPGITLAICAPHLRLTLLDRAHKKITFVQRVVAHLQLCNCQVVALSAEALARRLLPEERFEAVVARGVGSVAHVLSLAAPLLQPGGLLLLRKPLHTSELQEAAPLLTAGAWGEVLTVPLAAAPWALLGMRRRGSLFLAEENTVA